MKWIKIPIEVLCPHPKENSEDIDLVEMEIRVDDPEVPAYKAVCPKCGKSVLIAFGDFIYESKEEVE